jgi:hypothetical protein
LGYIKGGEFLDNPSNYRTARSQRWLELKERKVKFKEERRKETTKKGQLV